jgi:hypothetical protein
MQFIKRAQGIFIKLGQKHASKDEGELAIFEVFGECRLGVRGFGLLLAVVGFDLRLGVPSSVYFVGYSAHTGKQAILAHIFPTELGEGKMSGEGVYISPREGVGSAGYYWEGYGEIWT